MIKNQLFIDFIQLKFEFVITIAIEVVLIIELIAVVITKLLAILIAIRAKVTFTKPTSSILLPPFTIKASFVSPFLPLASFWIAILVIVLPLESSFIFATIIPSPAEFWEDNLSSLGLALLQYSTVTNLFT